MIVHNSIMTDFSVPTFLTSSPIHNDQRDVSANTRIGQMVKPFYFLVVWELFLSFVGSKHHPLCLGMGGCGKCWFIFGVVAGWWLTQRRVPSDGGSGQQRSSVFLLPPMCSLVCGVVMVCCDFFWIAHGYLLCFVWPACRWHLFHVSVDKRRGLKSTRANNSHSRLLIQTCKFWATSQPSSVVPPVAGHILVFLGTDFYFVVFFFRLRRARVRGALLVQSCNLDLHDVLICHMFIACRMFHTMPLQFHSGCVSSTPLFGALHNWWQW